MTIKLYNSNDELQWTNTDGSLDYVISPDMGGSGSYDFPKGTATVSGVAPAVGLLDAAGDPLEVILSPCANINGVGIAAGITGTHLVITSVVGSAGVTGIVSLPRFNSTAPVARANAVAGSSLPGLMGDTPAAIANVSGINADMTGANRFFTAPVASVSVQDQTVGAFTFGVGLFTRNLTPPVSIANVVALAGGLTITINADTGTINVVGQTPEAHYLAELLSPAEIQATGIPGHYSFTVPESVSKAIVYKCVLTGTADGVDDVTLPIKSFQSRLRNGTPSYCGVAIPDKDTYISYIDDRPNGQIVVYKGYKFQSGVTNYTEIARVDLEDVSWDEGPSNSTIQISGHITETNTSTKTVDVTPTRSVSLQKDGATRVQCDVDFFINSGDTVTYDSDGNTFTAGLITITVNTISEQMDITEDV